MPSVSKAQQRFMGLVHAYKKGEVPASKVSKAVKDAAKSMKKKSTKKFASTKHKGLPNKVKSEYMNEDGHTDVASAERKLKLIIKDAMDTINTLRGMSNEDSLPSWWTDKITLAKDYVGKSRDYIMNPAESVNERKNPKRERAKKSFIKNLQKTEKTIKRVKQFAKSNEWGAISSFIEDDLVYDMTALKNDIDTIISMPVDEGGPGSGPQPEGGTSKDKESDKKKKTKPKLSKAQKDKQTTTKRSLQKKQKDKKRGKTISNFKKSDVAKRVAKDPELKKVVDKLPDEIPKDVSDWPEDIVDDITSFAKKLGKPIAFILDKFGVTYPDKFQQDFDLFQKDESIVENVQKVAKLLIKRGNNPKDAKDMVKKHYKKAKKDRSKSTPSELARYISFLSANESVNEATSLGADMLLGGIATVIKKAGMRPKTAKMMGGGFKVSKRDKVGFKIEVEIRGMDKKKTFPLQFETEKGVLYVVIKNKPFKLGKYTMVNQAAQNLKKVGMALIGDKDVKRIA